MTASSPFSEFPVPDPDALAHSERLAGRIRRLIEQDGGSIGFEAFMEAALYEPGLGYYSAGARNFGAAGDFVTAPEMGPWFARCIARHLEHVASRTGVHQVIEVGAGSGRMAADLLSAATVEQPDSWLGRYAILERSADLRARQKATITAAVGEAACAAKVTWLDAWPSAGSEALVIANELLDALPATAFTITAEGVRERRVTWRDDRFQWTEAEPSEALVRAWEQLDAEVTRALSPGYCSEINLRAGAWLGSVGEWLGRGAVLLFDYGYPRAEYYHPQRTDGTLQCHYRHRAHADPFLWPGLQDISVHVDFTAVAEAALGSGFELAGFTSQSAFLIDTGLLDIAAALEPGSREQVAMAGQLKRLMLPGEMGDAVKVMALSKGEWPAPAPGFREIDFRPRL